MNNIVTVRAKFIGEDGSLGFHYGETYVFHIIRASRLFEGSDLKICPLEAGHGSYIPYKSVVTFLQNWDKIQQVGR